MRSRLAVARSTRALLVGAAAALAMLALPPAAGAVQTEDRQVATSIDGTPIVYTLHLPDRASASDPVPAVLITHGWGGSRQRTPSAFSSRLMEEGYAVLSWDQRGFGQSGGQVEVDDPDWEARDVSALIDALASDPRIATDAPGDPRVGMSGGSYAGGVQWITAATDRRVDAIAPEIAWHNLLESLIPEGVVKAGWGAVLYGGGQTSVTGGLGADNPAGPQAGNYNPQLHRALAEGVATGEFSPQTREFFAHRGPDYLLDRVRAPAFIIQGTIDTLFPPSQAVSNYRAMERSRPGVPLKMAFYCSGHGTCPPFDPGPPDHIEDRILAWFDRYVKGERGAPTGPRFEYVTNDGVWRGARDYPVPRTRERTASGSGTVAINGGPTTSGLLAGSDAPASLEVPLPSHPGTLIGAPRIELVESGIGTATDQPNEATLFFQIVNKARGEVLGHQITPKVVATDGSTHRYEFSIEPVSYTVADGDELVLQVASTSTSYEPYRGAAVVDMERIDVSVPELRAGGGR
jgi:ABC-2 type transport system ATP-binding protein